MNKIISGVYILKLSEVAIKIGRSKNIEKRLKQYVGYHAECKEPQKLLIVYTIYHK